MPKIVDSFLFFNEIELLRTRLEYLGPQIDHFVIAEANCDFSGKPKHFIIKELLETLPYFEKISYCPLKVNFYELKWIIKKIRYLTRRPKFLWKIQDFQRNAVIQILQNLSLQDDDIILFGDLDEFPNIELLRKIKSNEVLINSPQVLQQFLYYYHINIRAQEENWRGTELIPYKVFHSFSPHKWRSMRDELPYITRGGYHFSYFMSPEMIRLKIQAIAEVEKLKDFKNISLEAIQIAILHHRDVYQRDIKFVEVSHTLPIDLQTIFLRNMPNVVKVT